MNVIIGREFQKEFESIRTLTERGYVSADIIKRASGNLIETENDTFEFVSGAESAKAEARAYVMERDGASWFANLRGGGQDNGTAAWLNLIERVAAAYHKQYSLVEYIQSDRVVNIENKATYLAGIKKIVEAFFPSLGAFVRDGSREEGVEDIYGISLRVELSGGTGESVPVLGKIFFRKVAGRYVPIESEVAAEIDAYLATVVPPAASKKQGGERSGSASDIIDAVLRELNGLFSSSENGGIAHCIVWSGEKDAQTVREIADRIAHDNVELECTAVRVLSISHVEWVNPAFIVATESSALLRAIVGLNKDLTLTCLNCGGEPLITNGRVLCSIPGEDGEIEKKSYFLDITRDDFGLKASELEEIRKYSGFSKHYMEIHCPESERPQGDFSAASKKCSRRLCAANADNLGTDEEPKFKCKDCPYPEVVFKGRSGERYFTPGLGFARDRLTLVEHTQVCKCCGRTFSKENVRNGRCEFCRSAHSLSEKQKEIAKKTFKKYGSVFSVWQRLRYAGKEKLCLEQEDLLLFLLGDDVFVLDKMDVKDYGYLQNPRRVR